MSFGTRHTLSSQDDPERGIGAARDWIKGEVVWRNSTEPVWTHSRRFGNVTTIENLNKDDVQVGVRAIDGDGNRSPVATP